jgi:L-ribulokinase
MPGPVVVGVDFGTLSGRAVVVSAIDGRELGSAAHSYEHGSVERTLPGTDIRLPADWALQVPADYLSVVKNAVPAALAAAGVDPDAVIGIGTDFTASTMIPVLADGTPLEELPEFATRLHAHTKLWKHHAAQEQAARITNLAAHRGEPWLSRYGGFTSSEWQYAKGLQLLEEDPQIYERMDLWVEAADWIVWQLTGTLVRNAGSAGYKGLRQDGSYPSAEFLGALNPDFSSFAETKLAGRIGQLGDRAGGLTAAAAGWTGIPEGTSVAVGTMDAHAAGPAARATRPGHMVAIMGTSTCHVMNYDRLATVPGTCGVVHGGIVPGLWGYEAGQSGVGDMLAWFVNNQVPASYFSEAEASGSSIHQYLTQLGMAEPVGAHGLVALDWLSGNRSVLVDHELSGVILGLTLASRSEQVYRALLESTAFGARVIIETFAESGMPVTRFTATGGLVKNELLMQLYADVLRMPVEAMGSELGPALGAAMHAAVAAGAYPDLHMAAEAIGASVERVYVPRATESARYDELFAEYVRLHDHFGRGGNDVMHRLREIRRHATGAPSQTAAVLTA